MAYSKGKKSSSQRPESVSRVAEQIGKVPPQAPEMEESVLGALMIEKEAFAQVNELLKAETFYKDQHQKIYQAIVHLVSTESPVDMYTVIEQLKKDGTLDEVGGPAYVASLTQKVASAAHIYYQAQILSQKYTARQLINMAGHIEEDAFDETIDVKDVIEQAGQKIFDIGQNSMKRDVVQINEVIQEAFNRINKASKAGDKVTGVPTGFVALDQLTAGWQPSDLIIIAARPAMGKTAFVLSMAKQMACDYNRAVAMFSLEMSNVQLVNRLLMNVCEIPGDKIRTGQLTKEDWNKLNTNVAHLINAPIFIDDTPSLSVFELRNKARNLKRKHDIQCIIIDYLQLMNASGMDVGSREQEVSTISRNLKALAKELDIPIIALSQLNRNVESRGNGAEGKRPQLSDLRESGAIEQDADMVCFIHRPEYYFKNNPNSEGYDENMKGMAEIIVAKHRNGATDIVNLRFIGEYAKFANPDVTFSSNNGTSYGGQHNQNLSVQTITSKMNADGASIGPDILGDNSKVPY